MFLTPLRGEAVGKRDWKLTDDLDYLTDNRGLIRVPVDFVSDLASIPAPFRVLIPVNGLHRKAAVLHDWLYFNDGDLGIYKYTRAEADALFLQAMTRSGVAPWRRNIMYAAVRLGGWPYWEEEPKQ